MEETRKRYVSPAIESERVSPPEAWACTIYNAGGISGGWSGYGIGTPTFVCP